MKPWALRSAGVQGDYVVLASEGHCLCGVDVAAPQQLRRGPQQPVLDYLKSFRKQFTAHEVRGAHPEGPRLARRGPFASAPCVRSTVTLDVESVVDGNVFESQWHSQEYHCPEPAIGTKQRMVWLINLATVSHRMRRGPLLAY